MFTGTTEELMRRWENHYGWVRTRHGPSGPTFNKRGIRHRASLWEPGSNSGCAVIPEAHEHLSFLMGADAITDDDLTNLGVKILERYGSASRGLLVPAASLSLYSALVRERLSAGFWNEIVGRQEILFIFKLPDGMVREVAFSEATSSEIAELCSSLNGDPIEQTSDLPRYLSGNPFYRELIAAFYSSELS